ncbi:MAG: O-antigen ligase family protein [Candidatus Cloacimonetes bacterium]|nr:O-antigen ligase family protein [Candidatus Cloacimonadota bacterium]
MSRTDLSRFSAYAILFFSLSGLFLMPLFRGVIYPVERTLFTAMSLFLLILVEWRNLYLGSRREHWLDFKRPVLILPGLWLFGLLIHCFVVSRFPYASLLRWLDFCSALIWFYLAIILGRDEKRRGILFWGIASIGTFYAAHALLIYFGVLQESWWEKPEFVSGTFVNHNHFAGLLQLTLFVQASLFYTRAGEDRFLPGLGLLIQLAAFVLALSRGSWLAFFLSLFVLGAVMLFAPGLRKRGFIVLFSWFASVLAFLGLVYSRMVPALSERFFSFFQTNAQFEFMDFRIRLWKSTWEAFCDSWLFGHGLRSFEWAMLPYRSPGFEYLFDYAHNDWLQFLMEMGLVFALCLSLGILILLIRSMLRLFDTRLQNYRFETVGMAFGCLCLSLHGLTDFNLHIYGNLCLYFFCLGLLVNPIRQPEKIRTRTGP